MPFYSIQTHLLCLLTLTPFLILALDIPVPNKNLVVSPTQTLKDCVCVVTGASRGIGKGIALELGCQGAIVYVTGTSSTSAPVIATKEDGSLLDISVETDVPGTVEETAKLISELGGTGIPVICNHANDNEVKALFQRVANEQGRLDILVNNAFRLPAGMDAPQNLNKKFWEQGVDMWDTLNIVGPRSHYVASCYAVPLMIQTQQSKKRLLPRPLIAMISSFGGLAYQFNVAYGVSKAAVDRLAKDMAVELTPHDICVTSFWPGLVRTERNMMLVESGDWDKYVKLPMEVSESCQFTGRGIAAVAADAENIEKTGTYQVVAELADEYGFTDVDGTKPPSIRSLKFLLPSYAFDPAMREMIPQWLIPDWKLPFSIMAQGKPPDKDQE